MKRKPAIVPRNAETKSASPTTPENAPGALREGEAFISTKRDGSIERKARKVEWQSAGLLLVDGIPFRFVPLNASAEKLRTETLRAVHLVAVERHEHHGNYLQVDGEWSQDWVRDAEGQAVTNYLGRESLRKLRETLFNIERGTSVPGCPSLNDISLQAVAFAIFEEEAITVSEKRFNPIFRKRTPDEVSNHLRRPRAEREGLGILGVEFGVSHLAIPAHKSYTPIFLSAFSKLDAPETGPQPQEKQRRDADGELSEMKEGIDYLTRKKREKLGKANRNGGIEKAEWWKYRNAVQAAAEEAAKHVQRNSKGRVPRDGWKLPVDKFKAKFKTMLEGQGGKEVAVSFLRGKETQYFARLIEKDWRKVPKC